MLKTFIPDLLFGEISGLGPPRTLALHGWARSRQDMRGIMENEPGILVDLPGFGTSPPPRRPWSTSEYADVIAPLLSELERPRTLIGHSFGGRVAVHLAVRPGLVDRLVLVGTPLVRDDLKSPKLRYRVLRWAATTGLVPNSTLERVRRRHGSRDYNSATGIMRQILVAAVNESYEEQLRRIKCPTVLICGEFDTAATPEMTRKAAKLLSDGRVSIVEGTGHLLDEALVSEVRRWMQGVPE